MTAFLEYGRFFGLGGPVMWPLLLCSVLGLAIIVDRAIAHFSARLDFAKFLQGLLAAAKENRLKKFLDSYSQGNSPIVRLARVYVKYLLAGEHRRNEALKREGGRLLAELDQRMRLLATVAHVAPLLGLLGTVLGLVTSFQALGESGGLVQPGELAGGIWAALITTVFGLSIGIPCMVAHHYFHSLTDRAARQMKELVSELDEAFDTGCDLCRNSPQEDFTPSRSVETQVYEERT